MNRNHPSPGGAHSSLAEPEALLGGFRLVERIGVGGMGEVWRAENVLNTRMVRAIKVIKPELAGTPDFHARFLREAEYLELLQHPNILRVENVAEHQGVLFMVMELLSGTPLDAVVERGRGRLSPGECCWLIREACLGVAHAHHNGIIHRDIKPANLFWVNQGTVKVLDFGIARHGGHSRLTSTRMSQPGSPAYYAPELALGRQATASVDVYALGVTLFELLAGRLPFEPAPDATESEAAVFFSFQHVNSPMPDLRQFRPEVDAALVEAIWAATEKDPARRFATARQLADALEPLATPPVMEGAPRAEAVPSVPSSRVGRSSPHSGRAQPLSTRFDVRADGSPVDTGRRGALSTRLDFGRGEAPARAPAPPPSGLEPPAPVPPTSSSGVRKGLLAVPLVLVAAAGGWWWQRPVEAAAPPEPPAVVPSPAVPASEEIVPLSVAQPEPPAVVPSPPAPASEEMVRIPGGAFMMGSNGGDSSEQPVHRVTLSAYFMDKTEVTVGAYEQCVKSGRCTAAGSYGYCNTGTGKDNHPINCVNWHQAKAYCESEGKRLPTEAEWEFAARGTKARKYPWGNAEPRGRACWDGEGNDLGKGSRGSTCPVGSYPAGASPFGVLDLAGNVSEWVSDGYRSYVNQGVMNPVGPSFGSYRMYRGGAWGNDDPSSLRAANRNFSEPASWGNDLGFRCVRGDNQ